MKKIFLTGAIAFAMITGSLMLFSFVESRRIGDEVWKQLGMSKEQGISSIKQSFMSGYLNYYSARNLKNIATGNRAAIAKDLMTYTKQYLNSEVFKKEYELARKNAKPHEPVLNKRTKEDVRKEKIEETEKQIKDLEASMKTMKPDMVKIMEPILEMHKKNLKDYKDPNSQMIEMFYQNVVSQNENSKNYYEESVKRYELDFPADYRLVIKSRLEKFLAIANTVDFSAELKEVNGKKKFVNPVYEGKPYDWKQIYRAGKDVIDATKQFAEQWIKEIK